MSQQWNPTKNIQQTTQQTTLNATYNINLFANKLAKTNVQTKPTFCKKFKNHHYSQFESSSYQQTTYYWRGTRKYRHLPGKYRKIQSRTTSIDCPVSRHMESNKKHSTNNIECNLEH